MLTNDVHDSKQLAGMVVRVLVPAANVTVVNEVVPANAAMPIVETLAGISMLANAVPLKQLAGMAVRVLVPGNVILVNKEHC